MTSPDFPAEIEYVEGHTGQVVRRVPGDQVPVVQRAVYLREGIPVERPEEADEVVPIARVVRLTLDEAGRTVDPSEARRMVIQEFDAGGRMRRESMLFPDGGFAES